MIPELQIFSNSDYEPFAVFYWGTEGYGLTKQQVIDKYLEFYGDLYEEGLPDCSEPKLFYLVENGEYSEDNEPCYEKCSADTEGAKSCFGVIFDPL